MANQAPGNEILTVPNAISLLRLLILPVYVMLFFFGTTQFHRYSANALLICSCISDCVDGFIARKFHCISTVGKVLDPIADKCTQLVMLICVCIHYSQMQSVLALFAVKEFLQLGAGILYWRRGKMLTGALLAGKISTTVLFTVIILLTVFDIQSTELICFMKYSCIFSLLASFLAYGHVYLFRPNYFSAKNQAA